MMRKVFIFFLFLIISVCTAEDDILRNHKNLTPHEIVKKIEAILDRPANFRTKEDLVKRQQYLDLYKKNLSKIYSMREYPIRWYTYFTAQYTLFIYDDQFQKAKIFSLQYLDILKKFPDNFKIQGYILLTYLDLSYCSALTHDKIFMQKYLRLAKSLFKKMETSVTKDSKEHMQKDTSLQLRRYILTHEYRNYATLHDWDSFFIAAISYFQTFGSEENYEKCTNHSGYLYTHLSKYYELKNNDIKAEYYAQQSIKASTKENRMYLNNYQVLAKQYFKQKRFQSSLKYCNIVIHVPKNNLLVPLDLDWKKRIELLLIAAECYVTLGQKEKCLEYLNLAETKSKDPAIRKQIQSIRDKMN